ncbi:hypothetical protein SASPL_133340 [Salvia splendens]|uniref:Uncharacterized protein n=1 Tax=Salvia splendens TaxID=180675 RepID=A0A8X8ZI86_SALSN|nr:hypothetical protein SASPL_133340 [Salvia splendens]
MNTSKRNKNARAKKSMNQRTRKTSFAQVKAKLTKEHGQCPSDVQLFSSCFVSQNGNSSTDVSSKLVYAIAPNDIFAQIMGKDKLGPVRMIGQGVFPSDIWNGTPKSTSNRIILEYQEKVARLEAMLEAQQRICASQVHKGQDVRVSESSSLNATSTDVDQVTPIEH